MFSPVSYPQPSPPPRPRPSVRELAAAGYFRAIALWLNEPLVPQGLVVQVQADRPGCLKLTVEFKHSPIQEKLLRFLCHRIWQLNSELIEGIRVVARPVGQQRITWEKRIRIVTPAVKHRRASLRAARSSRQQGPLPPQLRRKVAHLSNQRLKTLRALVLTGSAVAAFVFGCLLEVVTTGTTPVLPSFSARTSPSNELEQTNTAPLPRSASPDAPQATTINYSTQPEAVPNQPPAQTTSGSDSNRSTVVDAALEPVGVIQHHLLDGGTSEDVTLLFGGDVPLDDLPYDDLADTDGLFTAIEDYLQADLSMITLSSPLTTAATSLEEELYERDRTDAVNLLADSGIDIVNLTNDNLMVHGSQGLDETLRVLDSNGIYRVGAGRNETEARRPEVIDVKGKRIAYLSYSMGGDRSAFEDRAGTNAQEMKEIVEDIQALRDQVDWIVVNYRWMEFVSREPNFNQTNLARMAIDQGADVVVGYHPDIIQGAEVYKGRPIAYSVGDFVFEADNPIADQDSAMLKVALKQEQMKVEFVPVRVKNSLPKTLEGPEGEAVLEKIEQASQQFDRPMKSPMVLDMNEQAPAPPENYDPDSPFVSPEDANTLPVEAEPDPATPPPLEPDPSNPKQETDAPLPADDTPAESKPLLETPDLMDQIDEDLLEWGPKPSDGQQEFKPIPQQLQEPKGDEVDAQLPAEQRRGLQPVSQTAQASETSPASLGTEEADIATRPTARATAPIEPEANSATGALSANEGPRVAIRVPLQKSAPSGDHGGEKEFGLPLISQLDDHAPAAAPTPVVATPEDDQNNP